MATRLSPDPLRELQHSPRPPNRNRRRGPTFKGKGGKEKGGKERGGRKRDGIASSVFKPVFFYFQFRTAPVVLCRNADVTKKKAAEATGRRKRGRDGSDGVNEDSEQQCHAEQCQQSPRKKTKK